MKILTLSIINKNIYILIDYLIRIIINNFIIETYAVAISIKFAMLIYIYISYITMRRQINI